MPSLKAGLLPPKDICSSLCRLLEQRGPTNKQQPSGTGCPPLPSVRGEKDLEKVQTFFRIACRQVLESDVTRYQTMVDDVLKGISQWVKSGRVHGAESHLTSSVYA